MGSTKYGYDDKYERTLQKYYSIYKKPIWILEFNYPSGSLFTNKKGQSKWLKEKIKKIRSLKNVQALFIYELLDEKKRFLIDGPIFSEAEASYGIYDVQNGKLIKKVDL